MSENVPDAAAGRQREEEGCGRSPGDSRGEEGRAGSSKGGAQARRPTETNPLNHFHPPECASSRRADLNHSDIPLTIGVEPEFKRMLEAKAKRLGISASELIGKILRADLSRLPPPTKCLICFFALLAFFVVVPCLADSFTGTVTRVIDGDTVVVASGHQPSTMNHQPSCKVRLAGVDAPELREPWGLESKMALSGLISNKTVVVHWTRRGRYRRIIGHVYLTGRSINRQLIALGWARHFRRYSQDKSLAQAERQARDRALGMWSWEQ